MPRGYRLLIIASGGIAVLTALGVGAFFGSLYGPDRKQYETVAGNNAGQKDYQGPSQSLPDIAGIPGPVERAIANRRPQTGQDHEKRDLAAQEASALWAFWMVLASFLSILITTVGTILLYQQIKLTREAVKDTGDATNAMREANMIAERAQRPWLAIEVTPKLIELTQNGYAFYLDIVANNVGQSAAQNYQIACYIFRVPQSIEEDIESRTDRIYQFWRDSFSEDGVMPRVLVPTQHDQFEYYEIGLSGKDVFRQGINGSRFVGVDVAICCQYISTLSGAIHRYEAAYSLHRVRENGDVVGIRDSEIPISAADMVARPTFYGLVD